MAETTLETADLVGPQSKYGKILKMAGWAGVGLGFLIFFTLMKLPEARITNLIQGQLSAALAPMGIAIAPEETSFSMLFGLRYKMKKVRVYLPTPGNDFVVDEISISPSLFAAMTGAMGGTLKLYQGKGSAVVSFKMKKTGFSADASLDALDLSKLKVLSALAGIHGGAVLSGSAVASGDTADATQLKGDVQLSLKNIQIESQTMGGFNIPALSISDGTVNITARNGKVDIKTVRLGKTGSSDDLTLTASGDLNLNKFLSSSILSLKAHVKPSDKVLKAFVLFDAFFAKGKEADGTYGIQIQGPLYAPMPSPLAP